MTAEKISSNQPGPVISANLGKLLGAVFLLFALLVVNSLYLVSITMLEQASGEIYQDYFYMLMFLVHLGLGLLLTLPFFFLALTVVIQGVFVCSGNQGSLQSIENDDLTVADILL
mgnify:CR=1 FL=1